MGGGVGKNGYISVIKDLGLKEPYSGRCPIVDGEIANDFAYYFTVSEQQPSAVALGVLAADNECVSAGKMSFAELEQKFDVSGINKSPSIFDPQKLAWLNSLYIKEMTPEDIIDRYFSHFDIFYLPDVYPTYECTCTRGRLEQVVVSLGRDEAYDILRENGKLELTCQFCNKKYVFTKNDVDTLFSKV